MKTETVTSRSDVIVRRSFFISRIPLPLLPFFLFVGFFLLWPIAVLVVRSFKGKRNEWTLANFDAALHGPYLHSFVSSIKLASTTAFVGSIIGAFFAYAIYKYAGNRLTVILDSISAVFANSGGVPLAFMFIAAFGMQGLVTKTLKNLGIDIYAGHFSLFSFTGLVLVYTFFQVPIMILVFKPALHGLKKEWSDANSSLGGNSLTYWLRIGIPILSPAFLGAFLLLFASGFSAYATARAMTAGNVPLVPLVIGTLIDGNVSSNEANLGSALAVGMIFIAVVTMSGYLIAQKYASRWRTK